MKVSSSSRATCACPPFFIQNLGKRKHHKFYQLSILIFTAIIICCCTIANCRADDWFRPPLFVHIHAAAIINVDPAQQPLPVVLRVYQLRDARPFMQTSFVELTRNDKQLLQADLLARKEAIISPHTMLKLKLQRNDAARYLCVMAMFRKPANADKYPWRICKPIATRISGWLFPYTFNITENYLEDI